MGTIIITNHEVLTTEREPEGQPRRARGDNKACVARSAARGGRRPLLLDPTLLSAVIFEFENVCHIRAIRG